MLRHWCYHELLRYHEYFIMPFPPTDHENGLLFQVELIKIPIFSHELCIFHAQLITMAGGRDHEIH
jgi:hypothetical protein